jgi:hypothetical protein
MATRPGIQPGRVVPLPTLTGSGTHRIVAYLRQIPRLGTDVELRVRLAAGREGYSRTAVHRLRRRRAHSGRLGVHVGGAVVLEVWGSRNRLSSFAQPAGSPSRARERAGILSRLRRILRRITFATGACARRGGSLDARHARTGRGGRTPSPRIARLDRRRGRSSRRRNRQLLPHVVGLGVGLRSHEPQQDDDDISSQRVHVFPHPNPSDHVQ